MIDLLMGTCFCIHVLMIAATVVGVACCMLSSRISQARGE